MTRAGDNKQTPTVFTHRRTGCFVVASRELAAMTAHNHSDIMRHVRTVAAVPKLAGGVFWHEYAARRSGRIYQCAHLAKDALIGVFNLMHNVPGCRNIRAVLDTYLQMIDKREAEQRAKQVAERQAEGDRLGREARASLEDLQRSRPKFDQAVKRYLEHVEQRKLALPAPDSEIRPPDPEPADTLEPIPPPESWEINYAIKVLERGGLPVPVLTVINHWNAVRRERLQAEARSWTDVGKIYATTNPNREVRQ